MAKQFQWRRGTTADHSTFTGAEGEVTVDLDKETLVVHDGATAGGFPLMKEDASNYDGSIITELESTGIDDNATSTAITIDSSEQVGIGTNSPIAKLQVQSGDIADTSYRDIALSAAGGNEPASIASYFANGTINSSTAVTIADHGNREGLVIVSGTTNSGLANTFGDIVAVFTNVAPVVINTGDGTGSSPVRTYTASGTELLVQLASGSGWSVRTMTFGVSPRPN